MRKFVAGLLVGIMIAIAIPALAANAIRIVINGQEVFHEVPPTVIHGTTMVPLRFIADTFGATTEWDSTTNTIKIWQSREQSLWLDLLEAQSRCIYNWIDACRWSDYRIYTDASYDYYQGVIQALSNKLQTAPFSEEFRKAQITRLGELSVKLVECSALANTLEYMRSKQ
jgi:hypothetical protein